MGRSFLGRQDGIELRFGLDGRGLVGTRAWVAESEKLAGRDSEVPGRSIVDLEDGTERMKIL